MITDRDVQRLVWPLVHTSMTRDMEGHGALVEALDVDEARAVAGVLAFIAADLMTAQGPAGVDLAVHVRSLLLDLAHQDPGGTPPTTP